MKARRLWPGLHGSEPVPAWSDLWERLFCAPAELAWWIGSTLRRLFKGVRDAS